MRRIIQHHTGLSASSWHPEPPGGHSWAREGHPARKEASLTAVMSSVPSSAAPTMRPQEIVILWLFCPGNHDVAGSDLHAVVAIWRKKDPP
jgi:hypothetical protein